MNSLNDKNNDKNKIFVAALMNSLNDKNKC